MLGEASSVQPVVSATRRSGAVVQDILPVALEDSLRVFSLNGILNGVLILPGSHAKDLSEGETQQIRNQDAFGL